VLSPTNIPRFYKRVGDNTNTGRKIAYPKHSNTSSVRIGMIFQKHTDGKNDIYIPALRKDNVIWSNEVFLPI